MPSAVPAFAAIATVDIFLLLLLLLPLLLLPLLQGQ
jgi:hypothetical protein